MPQQIITPAPAQNIAPQPGQTPDQAEQILRSAQGLDDDANQAALPQLDLSKSIPLDGGQDSLPQLDLSKSIPLQSPQAQTDPLAGAAQATGISARPKGTRSWIDQKFALPSPTEVGNWFDDIQSDVRNGTHVTWVGSLLHRLGAKGTEYGVAPGLPPGVVLTGALKVAHAPTQLGQHPVRAANELLSGAGEALSPLAVAQPEALPFIALASGASKLGRAIASRMGADDDTAELIGNVAGLVSGGKSISKMSLSGPATVSWWKRFTSWVNSFRS
jgi:hypothetical protein